MILASDQIKKYEQDGVIIIRDIFKPWINTLREGFEKVLKNLALMHVKILIKVKKVDFLKIIVIGSVYLNL